MDAQTHDDMLAVIEAKVEDIQQKFFIKFVLTPVLASTSKLLVQSHNPLCDRIQL